MDVHIFKEDDMLGMKVRGNQIEIMSPSRLQVGVSSMCNVYSTGGPKKSLFERVLIKNTRFNEQLRQQVQDIQEMKQKRHHHLFYDLTELRAEILQLNKSQNCDSFYLKRNNIYPRRSGCDPKIVSTDLAQARFRIHLIETRRMAEKARVTKSLDIQDTFQRIKNGNEKNTKSVTGETQPIPQSLLPPIEKVCRSLALQDLKSQIFQSAPVEKIESETVLPPIKKAPVFFPKMNLYELKSLKMRKKFNQDSKHVKYKMNRFLDGLEKDRELLYSAVVTPSTADEQQHRNEDRTLVKERWQRLVQIIIQRLKDRRIVIREGFRRFVVERWRAYKNLPNDESITTLDLPQFFRMIGQEKEKEKQLFKEVISEIKCQQEKALYKC